MLVSNDDKSNSSLNKNHLVTFYTLFRDKYAGQ